MKDTALEMLMICLGEAIWVSYCNKLIFDKERQVHSPAIVTITFHSESWLNNIYAIFLMSNLLNQSLVYTATSNTAAPKRNASPIRAKTNANVETIWEKKHRNSVSFNIDSIPAEIPISKPYQTLNQRDDHACSLLKSQKFARKLAKLER